jgi:hypothetical protein
MRAFFTLIKLLVGAVLMLAGVTGIYINYHDFIFLIVSLIVFAFGFSLFFTMPTSRSK